ncbi:MAG TPA: serine hydrolase domain-containing protein [Dehalococcoidia bacterium]|nr:serine hydrolase domain-containing protein [Dehalococcoidia bacterium]
MSDPQRTVQALIDDMTATGAERGLQVAAYLEGKLVVDAWSGVADRTSGESVTGDTLFTVFSSTKGLAATVIHLLADRGRLDYDDPIARHWPEFGAAGKGRVTIRQALAHLAGIPQMPDGLLAEDLADWDKMSGAIAALPPLWEPGTRTGYHALTYGWIVGELARRVDGRPIAQIVAEEICRPLRMEDLYFGIPDAVEGRVARLENGPAPTVQRPASALMNRAIPPDLGNFPRVFNRPEIRRASIPGAGGIMSARALARHYAALTSEVEGIRLLSEERVRIASTPQTGEMDLVLDEPRRKGLGYFLGGPLFPMGDRITVFGHTGAGGSIGFADPEHRFAFALTKNRLVWDSPPGETTADRVARAVRAALGIPESAGGIASS